MARRKRGRISAYKNNQSYLYWYGRLKELAISRFKWEGLPDSVDARFLELTLYKYGMAVYFNDEVMGDLALPCMADGDLNVYDIPTRRTAYANNRYIHQLSESDSVIIYDNMLHTVIVNVMEYYAYKLYEIDRTGDVNVKAQKTPVVILADEKQRLTMLNLYNQYDGNQPFIFGDNSLDIKKITSLTTNAPYVADKLQELKQETWNEALAYLGISNVNSPKRDRMITDEVYRGMGGTLSSRSSALHERQEACEKINAMFGTNISVSYREDEMIQKMKEIDQGEGGETDDE